MPIATSKPFVLGGTVGGKGAANKPADVATACELLAIREVSRGKAFRCTPSITFPGHARSQRSRHLRRKSRASAHSGAGSTGPVEPPTPARRDARVDRPIPEFVHARARRAGRPGGATAKFHAGWSLSAIEPGVVWQGRLKEPGSGSRRCCRRKAAARRPIAAPTIRSASSTECSLRPTPPS